MGELMFVATDVEGNIEYLTKLAISFQSHLTSDTPGMALLSLISLHDTATKNPFKLHATRLASCQN